MTLSYIAEIPGIQIQYLYRQKEGRRRANKMAKKKVKERKIQGNCCRNKMKDVSRRISSSKFVVAVVEFILGTSSAWMAETDRRVRPVTLSPLPGLLRPRGALPLLLIISFACAVDLWDFRDSVP